MLGPFQLIWKEEENGDILPSSLYWMYPSGLYWKVQGGMTHISLTACLNVNQVWLCLVFQFFGSPYPIFLGLVALLKFIDMRSASIFFFLGKEAADNHKLFEPPYSQICTTISLHLKHVTRFDICIYLPIGIGKIFVFINVNICQSMLLSHHF